MNAGMSQAPQNVVYNNNHIKSWLLEELVMYGNNKQYFLLV